MDPTAMTARDLRFLVGHGAPVVVMCDRCHKWAAKWMTGNGWLCGRCRNVFIRRYMVRRAKGR
jgi:hypothetical protein